MSKVKVTVKSKWHGQRLKRRTASAIADALETTASAMVSDAKRRAPVDTGALRRSIRVSGVQARGGATSVQVEADIPYAVYVEMGTRHQRAQPFVNPAVRADKRKFYDRLRLRMNRI